MGVTKKAFKALRRASQKTDVSWPCVLNFHVFKLQKKIAAQRRRGFPLRLPGPVVVSGGMRQGSPDLQVLDGQGNTVIFPGRFCREVLQESF